MSVASRINPELNPAPRLQNITLRQVARLRVRLRVTTTMLAHPSGDRHRRLPPDARHTADPQYVRISSNGFCTADGAYR